MFSWSDYEMAAQRYTKIFKRRDDTVRKAAKRKEPNMDRMTKNVRAMGEAEYTRIVTDYAKKQYPELSRERAFSKIFTADDDAGQAIRKMWRISKDEIVGGDIDDPVGERDDDEDALEELNELAEQERRRNPKLSKAQSFTKVFTDLANAKLVRRERMQNRPR